MSLAHKNNPYRRIYKEHYGKIPKGYHIHHKDGNPLNNKIENLECLSPEEHGKRHGSFAKVASLGGKIGGPKTYNNLKDKTKWHSDGGKTSKNPGGYTMSETGKKNISKARMKSKIHTCPYGCVSKRGNKYFDGGNIILHMRRYHPQELRIN